MPLSQRWYKNKQQNLSKNQKRILRELWPKYGVELKYGVQLQFDVLFLNSSANKNSQQSATHVLDIGFGLGDSITQMALSHPEKNYLGCELLRAGIASALEKSENLGLTNVKVIRADVTMLLTNHLRERSLDEVCVFFPDPWPNIERDGGRRVIREETLQLFQKLLKPQGLLRVATDVEEYAVYVRDLLSKQPNWKLNVEINHPPCVGGPNWRPVTKYEYRAKDLGHSIWDFEYQFSPSASVTGEGVA
jgi:tRNA (guanine-N7-)-methyltransferase